MEKNVKIIAVTQPLEFENPEDLLSYCARVSNPPNQENFNTSARLLNYCIRKKHWSVFEMVNVVVEINTTRDIGRQILRHRSFHFQEFSQRYEDPIKYTGFADPREFRKQDLTNRQNSIEVTEDDYMAWWEDSQRKIMEEAQEIYQKALERGIAKEQARVILPEGLTNSRMYMNGTLRDWIHYCSLRMGEGTQKEHRLIAAEVWKNLKAHFSFLETLEK